MVLSPRGMTAGILEQLLSFGDFFFWKDFAGNPEVNPEKMTVIGRVARGTQLSC